MVVVIVISVPVERSTWHSSPTWPVTVFEQLAERLVEQLSVAGQLAEPVSDSRQHSFVDCRGYHWSSGDPQSVPHEPNQARLAQQRHNHALRIHDHHRLSQRRHSPVGSMARERHSRHAPVWRTLD